MKNGKIQTILFDLDGTLTDPKEGIVNSIVYALEKMEIQEKNVEELDTFIGPPLRNSFKERYKLTDEQSDKATNLYREYFSAKGLFENKVYPGIEELLENLYAQNFKLFVATSKPTVFADKILRHFNLQKYFTDISGSNLDNTRTDKTEIISFVVSTHNLHANTSIMIGDRKHDIIDARNNAIKSVAVTYGYGSAEELSSHHPDYTVNSCEELKCLLGE